MAAGRGRMTTPADLYRTCRVSACRLETLQHYAGTGDEDRQRTFHAGQQPRPPRQGKLDDLPESSTTSPVDIPFLSLSSRRQCSR